jgi:TPR repeat protein
MNYFGSAALLIVLSLTGCDASDNKITRLVPEKADYDAAFKNLEFECVHESTKLPALDADAELLYRYGLHLTQVRGPKDFDQAARYYRIAAAHGHYRAATNLQVLLSQGVTTARRPARETLDLVEDLMAQGIPGGYYDMGHYLELGYGVKQDTPASRVYFRRAADLGNPEGLYYVGESLARIKGAGDVAFFMIRCSMQQGHRAASIRYGHDRQAQGDFGEAVRGFQAATRAGDASAAMGLKFSFMGASKKSLLNNLGLDEDKERSRRYGLIENFLQRYEPPRRQSPRHRPDRPTPPSQTA